MAGRGAGSDGGRCFHRFGGTPRGKGPRRLDSLVARGSRRARVHRRRTQQRRGRAPAAGRARPPPEPQPAHRARRSAGRDPREPRPGRRGGRFPGLERYGIRGFFARCLRAVHRDGGNVGPTTTPVPCLVPATDDYVSWNSGPPPYPWAPEGAMDRPLSGTVLARALFAADGRLVASRGEIVDLGRLKDAALKAPRERRERPSVETAGSPAVLDA